MLKRLGDAVSAGDRIYAVVKGSAVNNDGASKVGYTAPSVDGQRNAILAAQAMANVEPESISYVEAHGTGTPMGDPIEVRALTSAFRERSDLTGFCTIGSVRRTSATRTRRQASLDSSRRSSRFSIANCRHR